MDEPESYWTAVANVVAERPYGPGGLEMRHGTKHFRPGAKVYIIELYGGMCENVVVVGQHRKSKHLIKLVIDVRLLENFRAKVCYSPGVIAKIKEHYSPTQMARLTQEFAENACTVLPKWQAALKKDAGAPQQDNHQVALHQELDSFQKVPYAASAPDKPISILNRAFRTIRRFLRG